MFFLLFRINNHFINWRRQYMYLCLWRCCFSCSILPSAVLPSFYLYRCALDPQLGGEYLSFFWYHQYLLLICRQYAGEPHHISCLRKGLSAHHCHILGHFFPRQCKLVVKSQVLADAPYPKRTMSTIKLPSVYQIDH